MTQLPPLHILVTDLNHHVRNLLQRELTKAGHIIYTACNRREAREALSGKNPLDLIIFDPEVCEIFGEPLFMEFKERMPQVAIVFHTFSEFYPEIDQDELVSFVEKNEQSIHSLKKIVHHYSVKKATSFHD